MQNKSFKTAPNALEPEAFFVLLILFILAPFALANKEQSSKLADFEGHTYEKIDFSDHLCLQPPLPQKMEGDQYTFG